MSTKPTATAVKKEKQYKEKGGKKRKTDLYCETFLWKSFMLLRWHGIDTFVSPTSSSSSYSSCLALLALLASTRVIQALDAVLSFSWSSSSQAKLTLLVWTKSPAAVWLDCLFSLSSLPCNCTQKSLLRRVTGPRNGQAGPIRRFKSGFLSTLQSKFSQVVTRRPSVIVKERLKGESVCMIVVCMTLKK